MKQVSNLHRARNLTGAPDNLSICRGRNSPEETRGIKPPALSEKVRAFVAALAASLILYFLAK